MQKFLLIEELIVNGVGEDAKEIKEKRTGKKAK